MRSSRPPPRPHDAPAWPAGWVRGADPLVVDGLLAVLLALASLAVLAFTPCDCTGWGPRPLGVALVLAETLPLAVRRRRPVIVWSVCGIAATVYGVLPYPDPPVSFGAVVAVYSVAAYTRRRTAVVAAGVTALVVLVGVLIPAADAHPLNTALIYLGLASAWVLGDSARVRREHAAGLEDRAARLEREREQEALRAVAQERARIARELHDVVAHHVSMMVVQAEAGPVVARRDPDRAVAAFESIGATGRQALAEMRRLLGVLRQADTAIPSLAPQPGLDEVAELVEQVREAGLPVELVVQGEPRPLPAGVDLSAYRIVQEALTNTVKHAGPTHARVLVRYGEHDLTLEVVDDGRAAAAPAGDGQAGGHGLVGMRERVGMLGGQLRVGPRPEGGFAVTVRLPVEPAP